jgi:2-hydroxychromene-2-carboxylate isomerase
LPTPGGPTSITERPSRELLVDLRDQLVAVRDPEVLTAEREGRERAALLNIQPVVIFFRHGGTIPSGVDRDTPAPVFSFENARRLDFWFDYTCPYAYLASTQVESLARRTGDELRWRPMLLGGVFRANATPQKLFATLSPQKAKHNADDLERWSREALTSRCVMPAGHPMRSVEALRATLATGCDPAVIHGFFRAYWVDNREISDPATMRDVLTAAGHDADAVLPRVAGEALRDALRAETEQRGGAGHLRRAGVRARRRDPVLGTRTARTSSRASPPRRYLSSTHKGQAPWHTRWKSIGTSHRPSRTSGRRRRRRWPSAPARRWCGGRCCSAGCSSPSGRSRCPSTPGATPRSATTFEDMNRWAEFWGVPLNFPAVFPVNSIKALRAYIALPEERRDAFRDGVFRAYWAEGRDIGDEAVLSEYLGDDAAQVLARTNDPDR